MILLIDASSMILCLIDPRRGAGLLAEPVEAGVYGAEPLPALVAERVRRVAGGCRA